MGDTPCSFDGFLSFLSPACSPSPHRPLRFTMRRWGTTWRKSRRCLKAAADANEKNRLGMTPIFYAAIKGSAAGIEALASGGADANRRDKIGKAPLDWAAFRGHGAAVAALLHAGARARCEGQGGPDRASRRRDKRTRGEYGGSALGRGEREREREGLG